MQKIVDKYNTIESSYLLPKSKQRVKTQEENIKNCLTLN